MKSIVVNKLIVATLLLMVATGLEGQKPAIDLISSHQQYRHPEAIIDTGRNVPPMFHEQDSFNVPPSQNEHRDMEAGQKSRRQVGPSLDSIFQKEKTKRDTDLEHHVKNTQIIRQYLFLKFFIYISALN
jgi:hypothetical protein